MIQVAGPNAVSEKQLRIASTRDLPPSSASWQPPSVASQRTYSASCHLCTQSPSRRSLPSAVPCTSSGLRWRRTPAFRRQAGRGGRAGKVGSCCERSETIRQRQSGVRAAKNSHVRPRILASLCLRCTIDTHVFCEDQPPYITRKVQRVLGCGCNRIRCPDVRSQLGFSPQCLLKERGAHVSNKSRNTLKFDAPPRALPRPE